VEDIEDDEEDEEELSEDDVKTKDEDDDCVLEAVAELNCDDIEVDDCPDVFDVVLWVEVDDELRTRNPATAPMITTTITITARATLVRAATVNFDITELLRQYFQHINYLSEI